MDSREANAVLRFAREELARYLMLAGWPAERMPRIVVDARDETEDAYIMEGSGRQISVAGSNPRSALIGIYAYLKEIGFAFYAPGKDYTVIPELRDERQLLVPETSARALHSMRGVCIEGAESLEHMLEYVDWMPKAGMNICFIQFFRPDIFWERWYGHLNNPELPPRPLAEEEKAAFDEKLVLEIRKRGLLLHRVGHGWTSRALGYAGNGWHREPEPADEAVRSRIALTVGKRKLYRGIPANTNLCYARENVRQALVDEVVSYAEANPGVDAVHFWLADEYNNLCECEACRNTTLSDQYVTILNRLDEALAEKGLPTRIVFLLYQELLWPPKEARLRNPDRFILMFAPISRTFERPYPPEIPPGDLPPFRRNRVELPVDLEENLRYYEAWRKVFPGDAFIYDYHLGRAHYGDPGYMKISRTLYQDIQRLRDMDFLGMVACQELRVSVPNALPIYLMGRCLWGGSDSPEQIARTYFSGLYGPSADRVRTYFEQVSALCDTDYTNAKGPRLRPDLAERYRKIAILSIQAEAEVGEPDSSLAERFRSVLRQNAAWAEAVAALAQGNEALSREAFDRFCRIVREREKIFSMDYDVYRAIEVMQRYTGLKQSEQAN